ncbi:hypothetical protein [Horticoccus sp. 23ND18S-11]|uniref:hypothetical protein n=1 Tax=Horticoccus sp. 23ND18S-11 TaxID=3391832 RepID=UPI0039C9616C
MNLAATMSLSAGAFLGPLSQVRGQLGGVLSGLAALGGASLSVAGAIAGIKDALALGDDLGDLATKTGASVSELVVLRQALDNAGAGAGAAGPLIAQMQKALTGINESGEPTKKIFSQLGLDLDALKAKKPVEQIIAIAAGIRGLNNPAEQAQAAMQIFGRSGAEALAFLKDPAALEGAAKMLGTLPATLERNAAGFGKINDQLANFRIKKDQFFVGMTEGVAAALDSTLDDFEKKDFTPIGLKAGRDFIGPIIEIIKQGKITEALGVALSGGVKVYLANFLDAAVGSAKIVWAYLRAPFQVIAQDFGRALQIVAQEAKIAFFDAALAINRGLANVGLSKEVSREFFRDLIQAKSQLKGMYADQTRADKVGFGDQLNNQIDRNLAGMDDLPGFGKAVADAVAAELDALLAPFRKTVAENSDNLNGKSGRGGPGDMKGNSLNGSVGKIFEQNSDRLAKIGLFVGGAGGPAVDYARRTARATEIMAGILARNGRIDQGLADRQALWL